jgi:hypothetical protein
LTDAAKAQAGQNQSEEGTGKAVHDE